MPNGAERNLQDTSDWKCTCHEIDCEDCQLERLRELLGYADNAFDSTGVPLNIPKVNMIGSPTHLADYFLIGVLDEPTPECVNFILAHTGIPRKRSHIVKAVGWLASDFPSDWNKFLREYGEQEPEEERKGYNKSR